MIALLPNIYFRITLLFLAFYRTCLYTYLSIFLLHIIPHFIKFNYVRFIFIYYIILLKQHLAYTKVQQAVKAIRSFRT